MRIGLAAPPDAVVPFAVAADDAGLAAVLVPSGDSALALAAEVAASTSWIRIVVPVTLGSEHPVRLAEDVAVVDQLSNGRVVAAAEAPGLTTDEAAEDLTLVRQAWTSRWIRHTGPRWAVPARIHSDSSPAAIAVTPFPAQLDVPVWLHGTGVDELAERTGLPVLRPIAGVRSSAASAYGADRTRVAPVHLDLTGVVDQDRAAIAAAVDVGASIAVVTVPDRDPTGIRHYVARYLIPEAAMPGFPRIVAESEWPRPWPGNANDNS